MTANVKERAVVVCNEDKVNPVNLKWKWGEDDLPIVDQYTHLGVEISKNCSWDAHTAKVMGKGKSQVGKMDAILTDSHLDTISEIEICILINVSVPKLEYAILIDSHLDTISKIEICIPINASVPKLEYAGEVWEWNANFVEHLETLQMTAAKKILGYSSTTSNTVLRAEKKKCTHLQLIDARKLKWHYKLKYTP